MIPAFLALHHPHVSASGGMNIVVSAALTLDAHAVGLKAENYFTTSDCMTLGEDFSIQKLYCFSSFPVMDWHNSRTAMYETH